MSLIRVVFQFSGDYAAMLSRDHSKWNIYPASVRNSLRTLGVFNVTQVRHLILAVTHYFAPRETEKTFRMIVSWIVRLMIASAGKVGRVEDRYAKLAHRVHTDSSFRTARSLAEEIVPDLATDEEFEAAFAIARVKKPQLARYYLDTLERQIVGEARPELIPNDDTSVVNLEHIVPQNPSVPWDTLTLEEANVLCTRLGNQALIFADDNVEAGIEPFDVKRPYFERSNFKLTTKIEECDKWTGEEITARQAEMAKIAVRSWPLKIQ